ncbi:hypothetical protein [Paraburkholderia graminis]|uniref:hypothetical protein n=1 Tax=Paraburkholderia graminis TaxID=60548 RepID=UPI0035B528F7
MNLRTRHGATAMILAARVGQSKAVGVLLELGADLYLMDNCQRTALAWSLTIGGYGNRSPAGLGREEGSGIAWCRQRDSCAKPGRLSSP